jgi:hypothetical protein
MLRQPSIEDNCWNRFGKASARGGMKLAGAAQPPARSAPCWLHWGAGQHLRPPRDRLTVLNEMGRRNSNAIERQLAHMEENDVHRAYLHAAEFWTERIEMMQF